MLILNVLNVLEAYENFIVKVHYQWLIHLLLIGCPYSNLQPLGSVPSPASSARQDAYKMRMAASNLSDSLEAQADLRYSLRRKVRLVFV